VRYLRDSLDNVDPCVLGSLGEVIALATPCGSSAVRFESFFDEDSVCFGDICDVDVLSLNISNLSGEG